MNSQALSSQALNAAANLSFAGQRFVAASEAAAKSWRALPATGSKSGVVAGVHTAAYVMGHRPQPSFRRVNV